jgi:hypothetical protein
VRYAHEEVSGRSDEDILRDMREGEQRARVLSEEEDRIVGPDEFMSYAWS